MKRSRIMVLLFLVLMLASCGISKSLHHKPQLAGFNATVPVTIKQSPTVFISGHNTLFRNRQNLWELYVEGDPLERGLVIGSLSDSIFKRQ
jgi:hypothetical protein